MTRKRRIYCASQIYCVVCYKIYALPTLGRFRGIELDGVVDDDDDDDVVFVFVFVFVFDSCFMNPECW